MTNKTKGFTLIEILIVVAIIAILASIVIVGVAPAQQSGRDARRISDLQNIRNGLQLFYSRCGFYPGLTNSTTCAGVTNDYTGMVTALTSSANSLGISSVPNDPSSNRKYYYSSSLDGSSYTLGAVLENQSNSVFVGYTAPTLLPSGLTSCDKPNYCVSL